MGRSGTHTISEYTHNGVTTKLRSGEANWHQVKMFDRTRSVIFYEGYDVDEAQAVWSMIVRLVT